MAVEDVFLIRTRLQALLEEHPQLTALIRTMPYECSITQPFLQAYFASEIPGSMKRLILRAVMGDPSLYPEGRGKPGRTVLLPPRVPVLCPSSQTPARAADVRISERRHPSATREGIEYQSGLATELSIPVRPRPLPVVPKRPASARGSPWHQDKTLGRSELPQALLHFPENQQGGMQDTVERAGHELCLCHLFRYRGQGPGSAQHAVLLACVLATGPRGAKLQNKIPKAVSDYFGLPRTSLLELAFLVDLLPLVHNGVIDRSRLCKETDSLNLLRILGWRQGQSDRKPGDADLQSHQPMVDG